MNILTTSVLLLFSIALSTNQQQIETTQGTIKIEKPEIRNEYTVKHDDYTLNISLENTNSNLPILVISIDVKNDAHFISPFEEKEFTGKFYFDLGNYEDLAFDGQLTETPSSIGKVIYSNNDTPKETIKWVTDNTTYKQPLIIKTINDFEVFGRIQFTIEPRCTFEEIPFAISYKDGEMRFVEPKC